MLIDCLRDAAKKSLCLPKDLTTVELKLAWCKKTRSDRCVILSSGSIAIHRKHDIIICSGMNGAIVERINIPVDFRREWTSFSINAAGDLFYLRESTFKRLLSRHRKFSEDPDKWTSIVHIEQLHPRRALVDPLERIMVLCDSNVYFFDSVTLRLIVSYELQCMPQCAIVSQTGELLISEALCSANPNQCIVGGCIIKLRSNRMFSPFTTFGPEKTLMFTNDASAICMQDLEQTSQPVKVFEARNSLIFSIYETMEGHLLIEQGLMLFKYVLQSSRH